MNHQAGSTKSHSQSGLSALPGLELLWAETTGDPRICIAILDGPVDLTHPCFAGADLKLLESTVPAAVDGKGASEHGTHVASVIFGQPGSPVRGIAPRCRGLIIPVFQSGEGGALSPCSQLDLARAIALAVQHGAQIINISGGQIDNSGQAHPLLAQAINSCADQDILIIAAAGNDGCDCLHIPAAEPSVLVVGAMDAQGSPTTYSNWGEGYRSHGILAPGEHISGATPGGGATPRSGTSYATPVVSGIAGLLLSIQINQGQQPAPRAARNAILDSAIGCDQQPVPNCDRLLAGRLNAVGALSHIKKGDRDMSEQMTDGLEPHNAVAAAQAQTAVGDEIKTPVTLPSTSGVQAAQGAAPGATPAGLPAAGLPAGRAAAAVMPAGKITPSGGGAGCGCGGGGAAALVYALGEIGYDFGTEARRDSIAQAMPAGSSPDNPAQFIDFLEANPWVAASIYWTLNMDATQIYVIQPAGAFADIGYERLREFLTAQLNDEVERVSVPGYISGNATLFSGQTVPVIVPDLRGMYSWTTGQLITAVLGEAPKKKEEAAAHAAKAAGIQNFLERVYYEIRNLGVSPQERAMNYAATDAFRMESVYSTAIGAGLKLDSMEVERSPICRPDSDCWDVKLMFFNPTKRLEQARVVYRFTIDVSDVIPVTVGKVRSWEIF